jgi:hypothetical protein
MVTLGSCGTCGATGLIAGGAMFCVDCNGHGARYACHNPSCTATPAAAAPPSRQAAHAQPQPGSRAEPASGHRFRNGRCENCGELQMLAATQGWPCKEPFFVW